MNSADPFTPPGPCWSVFTLELARTLARHGATIRSLERLVNKAVVQRLRESMELQDHFSVLNPADLNLVANTYGFSRDERRLLLAAILAAGMQEKLVTRVREPFARDAALAMLPIIERALADAEAHQDTRLASLRYSEDAVMSAIADDDDLDPQLERACAAIDRGMLALYAVEHGASDAWPDRDNALATEAYQSFRQALDLLESEMTQWDKHSAEWGYWRGEARAGLLRARELGGALP